MLFIDQSKLFRAAQRKLADGVVIAREGQAAVASYVNGELVLSPSTGASGEKFAGVFFSSKTPIDYLPNTVTKTAVARKITLDHDPIGGSIAVNVGGTVFAAGDPANAGQFSVSGREITLPSGNATSTATVSYSYLPTIAEARRLQGDVEPGFALSSVMRQSGGVEGGEVTTDQYDTDADWTPGLALKLGPDGRFTTNGSGSAVDAVVTKYPTPGSPKLSFSFNI